MKNDNIVVACIATGAAAAPYCAYEIRPSMPLLDSTLEDWFVCALKCGDDSHRFWWVAILLSLFGLLAGLLLKRLFHSSRDDGTELGLLRIPLVTAVLVPVGIATILLIVCNRIPQVLEGVVWPECYSKNWLLCSVVAAIVSYIVVELFNTFEHAFAQASLPIQVVIICCSPLEACLGCVVILGFVGGGLMGGFAVGRLFFGCPFVGAWLGTCIAIFALAFERSVFWPAYFTLGTPEGGK